MKRRRRAFFLVLALFIVTFISVLALAFLSDGSLNYRTSLTVTLEQQVNWLARAGLEDARVKIQKDPDFPPPMGSEGVYYSYAEQVNELGGTRPVGSFEVTVDHSHAQAPEFVVTLQSTGRLVHQGQTITKKISAELDLSPKDRRAGYTTLDNPNYYQLVNWIEEVP